MEPYGVRHREYVMEDTVVGEWRVLTVWVYWESAPTTFETLVHKKDESSWGLRQFRRYQTTESAKEGHERMVQKWSR